MAVNFSLPWRLLRRFAPQPMVEQNFALGIVRDTGREALPSGAAYDIVDFLVDSEALQRRGAATLYADVNNGTPNSVAAPYAVAVAPYSISDNRVFVVANKQAAPTGIHLYEVTGGAITDIGVCSATSQFDKPVFYIDKLILCADDGTAPRKVTTGSPPVLAALGGSPPGGAHACMHLSRLVLANDLSTHQNRLWFSEVPNIETTWDTANKYIDVDDPITALCSIQGNLIVFSKNRCWRVIGDTPPGVTGENMSLQPLANVGCFDGRALVVSAGVAYFAGNSGVYSTNGAGVTSLVDKPNGLGIQSYWRSLMLTGVTVGVGIAQKRYLIVSISKPSSSSYTTLLCYLPRLAWTRAERPTCCTTFALDQEYTQVEKIYGAWASGVLSQTSVIADLTNVFYPATVSTQDHLATDILPTVTTRVLGTGLGLKVFEHGHLHYDLRDAASDNPTMKVEIAPGLEATTFSTVTESPLAETTDYVRKRFTLNKQSSGLTIRLTQQNKSAKTTVYSIETEERQLSTFAEGQ